MPQAKANLFSLIQTSQRENLTSSALAYFLQSGDSSHQMLRAQLFNAFFGKGPEEISIKNIKLEHAFDNNRRIDLLIETDQGFYGIENKLTAGFLDNQLEDYYEHLSLLDPAGQLIALTPKVLERQSNSWKSVTWDNLLKIDDGQAHLWTELRDFVDHTLYGSLPPLPAKLENGISENEKEFLRVFISRYVDCSTTKIGSSKSYTGCYFGTDKSYIGYISVEAICDKPRLVILTVDKYLPNNFSNIDADGKLWLSERETSWQGYEKGVLGEGYQMCVLNSQPQTREEWATVGEELAISIRNRLKTFEATEND